MREVKSFCRLCLGRCGVKVTLDDDDRIIAVRGDRENPGTQGYICSKGAESHVLHEVSGRLLQPMKRVGDEMRPIGLEQALDEIGERMAQIIDEDGAQSLGFYRGTGSMSSSVASMALPGLASTIGGKMYSSMTVDQSAKWLAEERLGVWLGGKTPFERSDVWVFAGSNPLVSLWSWDTPVLNPLKALKAAKARGLKLIVIDPRKSEIANYADIHLQIYPGEDATIAAGMLHIILREGWEDRAFCAAHVEGLEALRSAVAPFTPELVASRAGVSEAQLLAGTRLFAHQSRHGGITTGTGPDMAAHANVAEHLYQVIEVVCGRFLREGETLPNPGVLAKSRPRRAEVVGPSRQFDSAPRSRVRGAVSLKGEFASPTIPEEILTPGPGRLRGLMVAGGNPATAIPDVHKVAKALRALDLLVVVDPRMSETARLAHYVLPSKQIFEHADHTFGLEMINLTIPFGQYTDAVAPPPAGSELCDEGYVCWAIAKRLGKPLNFGAVTLDMERAPSHDELLAIMAADCVVPFEAFKAEAAGGKIFDLPPRHVEPPGPDAGRFRVMGPDVAAELDKVLERPPFAAGSDERFDFRLISRRAREVINSVMQDSPSARRRLPFNPLSVHPDDLDKLGFDAGDAVEVISRHGRIPAIVAADPTLKSGVVSMVHSYGGLPEEGNAYEARGASTGALISLDEDYEPLQSMPRMSGVPIRIERRVN